MLVLNWCMVMTTGGAHAHNFVVTMYQRVAAVEAMGRDETMFNNTVGGHHAVFDVTVRRGNTILIHSTMTVAAYRVEC